MSLDAYLLSDKKMKNCLIKLTDPDLALLEQCITLLENKTGVYIDPYGTTRLYASHAEILLYSIEMQKITNVKITKFKGILQNCIEKNEPLLFEGD
jgi:hypothetical protein